MSNPLSYLGRPDRPEDCCILSQLQQKAFVEKLYGNRDPRVVKSMYGIRPVRDCYVPPTRGLDGTHVVMPKN